MLFETVNSREIFEQAIRDPSATLRRRLAIFPERIKKKQKEIDELKNGLLNDQRDSRQRRRQQAKRPPAGFWTRLIGPEPMPKPGGFMEKLEKELESSEKTRDQDKEVYIRTKEIELDQLHEVNQELTAAPYAAKNWDLLGIEWEILDIRKKLLVLLAAIPTEPMATTGSPQRPIPSSEPVGMFERLAKLDSLPKGEGLPKDQGFAKLLLDIATAAIKHAGALQVADVFEIEMLRICKLTMDLQYLQNQRRPLAVEFLREIQSWTLDQMSFELAKRIRDRDEVSAELTEKYLNDLGALRIPFEAERRFIEDIIFSLEGQLRGKMSTPIINKITQLTNLLKDRVAWKQQCEDLKSQFPPEYHTFIDWQCRKQLDKTT